MNWTPDMAGCPIELDDGRLVYCGGNLPSNCPAFRVIDNGHAAGPMIGMSLANDSDLMTELAMPPHEIRQIAIAYLKGAAESGTDSPSEMLADDTPALDPGMMALIADDIAATTADPGRWG